MTEETKKCNRCKNDLTIDKFKLRRDGSLLKNCIECNIESEIKCCHNIVQKNCVLCEGNNICKHRKIIRSCKDCGYCKHNKSKYNCMLCGIGMCEHKKRKPRCKICKGSEICRHSKQRGSCKICDVNSYLSQLTRNRIYKALGSNKELHSEEYLGTNIETIKEHLESQFKEGMTWANHGKWHIDHKIPIKYDDPTLEEQMGRLVYTNLQPLWAKENISKGNRYCD